MHYHDVIAAFLTRTGCEEKHLFQGAHWFIYQKTADVSVDVLTYQVGGIVPEYVKAYLDHIGE
jgi:hypothetical protein